ncbi:MAG: OmpH family outer membrane protein [Spirochaetales bacterium]|nr:OmpH family outer membrane protein [Spirochaetales bacterium]
MKKIVPIIAFLAVLTLCLPLSVSAETITRVGVLDLSKIYSTYFRESQAVRELEELRESIQNEIQSQQEEIRRLEEEKIEAEDAGNEERALELDQEIFRKKRFLNDFVRIKNNQLQEKKQSLSRNSSFLDEVMKAIQYIAESEGYSVVLKSTDPDIIWWNQETDITDLVIEHLVTQSGQ